MERRQSLAQLASIPDTEEWLVTATGRYIGEGFDDARLDTLLSGDAGLIDATLIRKRGANEAHLPRAHSCASRATAGTASAVPPSRAA